MKKYDPVKRLEARANLDARKMLEMLGKNAVRVKGLIIGAKDVQQARGRETLFREVAAAFRVLGGNMDDLLKECAAATAMMSAKAVGQSLVDKAKEAGNSILKFSLERAKRYWRYVCPENSRGLAATSTDKMGADLIDTLRRAVVEVERQAAIEGWTMDEIRKAIEDKWAEVSKNDKNFKFVDKSGRAWENGRYCQMLARTTATRVWNDSYLDRLAEEGFQFVKVSQHGSEPDCDVCRAWAGKICVIAGKSDKYPTVEDARAAGVFHPNCMCTWEYVDEDEDKAELEKQALKAGEKVDWNDPEAVEKHRNGEGGEKPEPQPQPKPQPESKNDLEPNIVGKAQEAVEAAQKEIDKLRADLDSISKLKYQRTVGLNPVNYYPKTEADYKLTRAEEILAAARKAAITDSQRGIAEKLAEGVAKTRKAVEDNEARYRTECLNIIHTAFDADRRFSRLRRTFDEADTRIIDRVAHSGFSIHPMERGDEGAHCRGTTVFLSPDSASASGSNNAARHEIGHAVLNAARLRHEITLQGEAAIAAAATADLQAAQDRFAASISRGWQTAYQEFHRGFVPASAPNGNYDRLPLETRREWASACDIFSAATGGRLFQGHRPEYWNNNQVRHEVVANATALAVSGNVPACQAVAHSVNTVMETIYGFPPNSMVPINPSTDRQASPSGAPRQNPPSPPSGTPPDPRRIQPRQLSRVRTSTRRL